MTEFKLYFDNGDDARLAQSRIEKRKDSRIRVVWPAAQGDEDVFEGDWSWEVIVEAESADVINLVCGMNEIYVEES